MPVYRFTIHMKTILVVDDEPKIVKLARDYLEHAGLRVVTANDGKSALAMNIACHAAIREAVPVGVISAESSNDEIMTRIFSAEGHINGQRLSSGMIGKADFASIIDAGSRMHNAPMYFYDAPNVKFAEMRGVARQMVAIHKCRVIFIDYLQILRWHDERIAKHEQVAAISLGIKELARELKIPIVALSQLKRDSEGREPELAAPLPL